MSNENTCLESYVDIVAVWPFGKDEINYSVPFNVRKRFITPAEMGAESLSALIDGRSSYSVGEDYSDATTVELEERKSTLKSTGKTSAAGRAYDVVLTLIINEKSTKSANLMDDLEGARHDFIVQLADGENLLIRSAENAYRCVAEEDFKESYQQKITITLENYNGIQRISV